VYAPDADVPAGQVCDQRSCTGTVYTIIPGATAISEGATLRVRIAQRELEDKIYLGRHRRAVERTISWVLR
jgi:hypothetical protein